MARRICARAAGGGGVDWALTLDPWREPCASTRRRHTCRLLEAVGAGEDVVITRAGKPVARLVAAGTRAVRRVPGSLRGRTRIADDFDEMPEGGARGIPRRRPVTLPAELGRRWWSTEPSAATGW
ncbi:type II toxin-antitoxin system Phd/YefM family antitoxin [Blastococcus sp. SYSU DS0616]